MTLLKKTIGNISDIFGLKKSKGSESISSPREKDLVQLSRLYATISHINKIIIRVRDRDTLFREICSAAITHGQFRLAWIGLTDPESLLVKPIATAGVSVDYLTNISISIRNDETGNGPIGRCIREGHCIAIHDTATDSSMLPWREKALKFGLHGAAAVPIRQNGNVIGAFIVYAS